MRALTSLFSLKSACRNLQSSLPGGVNCLRRGASKSVAPTTNDDEEDFSKPIRFSTSAACDWSRKKLRVEDLSTSLPFYKRIIFVVNLMVLLIYLFYRKRTDVDDQLDMPLGQRMLWVRELILSDEKQKLLKAGRTTISIDEELAEIEKLRKKYNYK